MRLTDWLKKAEHSQFKLWMLNRFLMRLIPFNAAHSIQIKEILPDAIVTSVPYQRRNWNHIKGIHACCIATVGELSAGLQLMRDFDATKYRLIMANLSVDYHYQAKKNLRAMTTISKEEIALAQEVLGKNGKTMIVITTKIKNSDDEDIATVLTTWQIKPWKSVKTAK